MQSLAWYYRRLRSMSLSELAWRARGSARDVLDSARVLRGWTPSSGQRFAASEFRATLANRELLGEGNAPRVFARHDAWGAALRRRVAQITANRLSFFDLESVDLGTPIDWHKDHSAGKRAPLDLINRIDYREFEAVGDCKLVWEPNRHHQLVVLGRAYRAFREEAIATSVVEQLHHWIEANPFGRGMNWRSPLELGIRLINWVYALEGIKEADAAHEAALAPVMRSMYEHCFEVRRKYSQASSANNHLIGEAAGVFVACAAFPCLPEADAWREEAAAILKRELVRQTYGDGCSREHAFGYHFFIAQFFLIAKLIAERTGHPFDRAYDVRLASMVDFALEMMRASRSMPKLGDADDGYVLDLGDRADDFATWAAVSALGFGRDEHASLLTTPPETAFWLYGETALDRLSQPGGTSATAGARPLVSRAFHESGYYLLQHGAPEGGDHFSVLVDCASLGYGPIAAHGHADALSIVLRAYGREVLVDAGTYDYFTYPEWRRYFRSTAAHNTVRIDARDQSEMLGPFLWGARAETSVIEWRDDAECAVLKARHDGYHRLASPVTHTRTVQLDHEARKVTVVDTLEGNGTHEIELFFHVAPECTAAGRGQHSVEIDVSGHRIGLDVDSRLALQLHRAQDGSFLGWVSDGYHRKHPSATIVAAGRLLLPVELRTNIDLSEEPSTAVEYGR